MSVVWIKRRAVLPAQWNGMSIKADTMLLNGKVYTVDSDKSWANAIAVKHGRIIFVGSSSEAASYMGEGTEIIDLEGKMVLPGFVDAHMHPLMSADIYFNQISLFESSSKDTMLEVVRQFIHDNPEQMVIKGGGFSRSVFDERGPRKEWLDSLESGRLVS